MLTRAEAAALITAVTGWARTPGSGCPSAALTSAMNKLRPIAGGTR